jgi:diguanylate cyclase (GGDEF)-like protein
VLDDLFRFTKNHEILAGKLPVYIDTEEEEHTWWGVVSVTLKISELLKVAELGSFQMHQFAYELWRINPDTEEKHIMASDYKYAKPKSRFIEKDIYSMNTEWHLKVWPIRTWYSRLESWILIIGSLLISFLIAFIIQSNVNLQRMSIILEKMAKSDPLTGIFNRRHFMESSHMDIERAKRLNENCYIILYDLDKFKNVNDVHGHTIGDNVLIDTTSRIKNAIRPYDLFARYGGEEFILYVTGITKKNIALLAERLRQSVCGKPLEYDGVSLQISASFGVSHIDDYDIKKAIQNADQALYVEKKEGRNRVAFWS